MVAMSKKPPTKVSFAESPFSPNETQPLLSEDEVSPSAKSSFQPFLPTHKQHRCNALLKGAGVGFVAGVFLFLILISIILVRYEENDRDAERAFDQYNIFQGKLKNLSFAERTTLALMLYFSVIELISMTGGIFLGRYFQLRRESDAIVFYPAQPFSFNQVNIELQAKESLILLKKIQRQTPDRIMVQDQEVRSAAEIVLAYNEIYTKKKGPFSAEISRFITENHDFFESIPKPDGYKTNTI